MAHILLVEDDVFSSVILQEILVQDGHTVRTVYDSVSALQLIHSDQRFDLAITDLLLANRKGLDLIKALRNRSKTMGVIAIGGEPKLGAPGHATAEAASLAGADAILIKPISRADLSRHVTALLK